MWGWSGQLCDWSSQPRRSAALFAFSFFASHFVLFRAVSPLRIALPSITITYYRGTPDSFLASAGHDSFSQRNNFSIF